MNEKLKDLEVLSNYLDQHELKEVASQVAKEAFRDSMGASNPHSKENIDFYAKQGAYLAVKEYAEENELIDLKELSKILDGKVNSAIKGMNLYNLDLYPIIKEAVEKRKKDIQTNADLLINQFLEDEESYSGLYKKLEGELGYILAEHLMDHFKESFGTEVK